MKTKSKIAPLFYVPDKITKDNFEEHMQNAVVLELATIPTYLYTYYSIRRSWGNTSSNGPTARESLHKSIYDDLKGKSKTKKRAQELTVDIQVYANKAASLIMSVVIEEMLHLSLASNVKQAVLGPPQIYSLNPKLKFPTKLPVKNSHFPIHLRPFGKAQLETLLKIESPKPFTDNEETIGKYYHLIEQYLIDNCPGPYDSDRPQLQQKPGFYGQNSINTVHYDKGHNPHFPGSEDSGGLIHVTDLDSALAALDEIVEQGEGNKTDSDHLDKDGDPVFPPPKPEYWEDKKKTKAGDFDDPSHDELSHFDRFLELYSLGYWLDQEFREATDQEDHDPEEWYFTKYFVYPQPTDPKTKDYPEEGQALMSNFANAVFSYILLMVEACYHHKGHVQFELFMMGVHKSMIWLLSYFGNSLRTKPIIYPILGGKAKTKNEPNNMAVTFEMFDFNGRGNPYKKCGRPLDQLKQMGVELIEKYGYPSPGFGWLFQNNYLPSLPNVGVDYSIEPNKIPIDYLKGATKAQIKKAAKKC
ncbi:MAG: ferritin-like domain-containing protein [Bacteroidota bacterium]